MKGKIPSKTFCLIKQEFVRAKTPLRRDTPGRWRGTVLKRFGWRPPSCHPGGGDVFWLFRVYLAHRLHAFSAERHLTAGVKLTSEPPPPRGVKHLQSGRRHCSCVFLTQVLRGSGLPRRGQSSPGPSRGNWLSNPSRLQRTVFSFPPPLLPPLLPYPPLLSRSRHGKHFSRPVIS